MADSVVILDTIPANLKTSSPSLMPFHISYSGPAAISTFMDVKPAKEEKMGAQSQPPPCNSAEVGEPEAVGQYQPDLVRATMSVDDDATGGEARRPDGVELQKPGEAAEQRGYFTIFCQLGRSPSSTHSIRTGGQ